MRKRWIVVMLATALVITAGASIAQRGRGGPGQGMRRATGGPCGLGLGLGLGANLRTELNLTDNQVSQLQRIANQFLADTQPLRAQLQTQLKELAVLWTAEEPNESAIRSKIAEVDRTRARIRDAMVQRTFSAMNVLTPAQRTKLRNLVQNRPGFGVSLGSGLGLGCGVNAGNCYFMGGPGGPGRAAP